MLPLPAMEDASETWGQAGQPVRLVGRGSAQVTYREVGQELFISVKTVETHMSHILRKLHLTNRLQLAVWAAHRGLA